jgi:hypothetical protein
MSIYTPTVSLVFLVFAILGFRGLSDIRNNQREMETTSRQAKTLLSEVNTRVDALKKKEEDVERVVEANKRVAEQNKNVIGDVARLRSEITTLKGQIGEVIDFGNRTLKAKALQTTGLGPSMWSMGQLGCPSLDKGQMVGYCAVGSPPVLTQVTPSGERRPVSSLSTNGFQDMSTAPRPQCGALNRGTLYVEKGDGRVSDRPLFCIKKSDGSYDWVGLATAPLNPGNHQ